MHRFKDDYVITGYSVLIVLTGAEWNSDATDLFEELSHSAKWKPVMAKVVGSRKTIYNTTFPAVQLVDTNGPNVCFYLCLLCE